MRLGIVCGLQSEKAALGSIDHPVAVAGASASRAYACAQQLAADGAECLISVGLAGGLMPHLKTGDLLLPREVLSTDGDRFPTHPLSQDLPRPADGAPILGSDDLIASAEDKARLAETFGASAVDMESHAVGMVAQQKHLPFYAIRVVADPSTQVLPASTAGAVAEDGSVNTMVTLRGLLSRPQDLPELLRLGRQASKGLSVIKTDGRAIIDAIARA